MKNIETSLKATLETLEDMEDFITQAIKAGYSRQSKLRGNKESKTEGVFVRLVKIPDPVQKMDDERPPRDKANCETCNQVVPVEWAGADEYDYKIYSEHSVHPKQSVNPINCKGSYIRVPEHIEITR